MTKSIIFSDYLLKINLIPNRNIILNNFVKRSFTQLLKIIFLTILNKTLKCLYLKKYNIVQLGFDARCPAAGATQGILRQAPGRWLQVYWMHRPKIG